MKCTENGRRPYVISKSAVQINSLGTTLQNSTLSDSALVAKLVDIMSCYYADPGMYVHGNSLSPPFGAS